MSSVDKRSGSGPGTANNRRPQRKKDDLACSMCKNPFPADVEYAKLKPCGCDVCQKCLLNAHAQRGTSLLVCQKCDKSVDSHQFYRSRLRRGGVIKYTTNNEESPLNNEESRVYKEGDFVEYQKNGNTFAGRLVETSPNGTDASPIWIISPIDRRVKNQNIPEMDMGNIISANEAKINRGRIVVDTDRGVPRESPPPTSGKPINNDSNRKNNAENKKGNKNNNNPAEDGRDNDDQDNSDDLVNLTTATQQLSIGSRDSKGPLPDAIISVTNEGVENGTISGHKPNRSQLDTNTQMKNLTRNKPREKQSPRNNKPKSETAQQNAVKDLPLHLRGEPWRNNRTPSETMPQGKTTSSDGNPPQSHPESQPNASNPHEPKAQQKQRRRRKKKTKAEKGPQNAAKDLPVSMKDGAEVIGHPPNETTQDSKLASSDEKASEPQPESQPIGSNQESNPHTPKAQQKQAPHKNKPKRETAPQYAAKDQAVSVKDGAEHIDRTLVAEIIHNLSSASSDEKPTQIQPESQPEGTDLHESKAHQKQVPRRNDKLKSETGQENAAKDLAVSVKDGAELIDRTLAGKIQDVGSASSDEKLQLPQSQLESQPKEINPRESRTQQKQAPRRNKRAKSETGQDNAAKNVAVSVEGETGMNLHTATDTTQGSKLASSDEIPLQTKLGPQPKETESPKSMPKSETPPKIISKEQPMPTQGVEDPKTHTQSEATQHPKQQRTSKSQKQPKTPTNQPEDVLYLHEDDDDYPSNMTATAREPGKGGSSLDKGKKTKPRTIEQELTFLKRVSCTRYQIQLGFVPNMNVPAEIIVNNDLQTLLVQELHDSCCGPKSGAGSYFVPALRQAANVAALPGIVGSSLAMPDVHSGYGFCIGNVAAFDMDDPTAVISPGGVGFDINCGVRLIRTNLMEADVGESVREELAEAMFKNIPVGVGVDGVIPCDMKDLNTLLSEGINWAVEKGYAWEEDRDHCEENGRMETADPKFVSNKAKKRGLKQLGTLGAGNHYAEIQVVDEIYHPEAAEVMGIGKVGQVCIMIHTGSRGLGHQVATDALTKMERAMARDTIDLNDRQLSCARISSREGKEYLAGMSSAANFAWVNRSCITYLTRKAFSEVFDRTPDDMDMHLVYDVCHNIAKVEKHIVDGVEKKLLVHRKGSTRAFPPNHPNLPKDYQSIGQPVLIGGTMGTCSYVLVGTEKGMEKTFGSTCHGAGRALSRNQSRKKLDHNAVLGQLRKNGISIRVATPKLVMEEAPESYKNVCDVVDTCQDDGISKKVVKLRPIAVIKG